MDENGKICDVVLLDNMGQDPMTGISKFFGFHIWADDGLRELIRSIPGVAYVSAFQTEYFVQLDPRYDVEFLRAEILAQIKIQVGG